MRGREGNCGSRESAITSQSRKQDSLAALAASIILLASTMAWAGDGELKAELQSRYSLMKSAMSAHDGVALAALLTPDFQSVDTSGQVISGAQMIEKIRTLESDPNRTSSTTLKAIAPTSDSIVVQQQYDMKTTKTNTDGSARKVELLTLSTDTWVRVQGALLCKRTVTNETSIYLDGQLVAHKAGPAN